MKSMTFGNKKYDSFPDQTARDDIKLHDERIKALEENSGSSETEGEGTGSNETVHVIADVTLTEETQDFQQALTQEDCEYLNKAKKISAIIYIPIKGSEISPTGTLKFGLYQSNWYSYRLAWFNGNFNSSASGNHIVATNFSRLGNYYGFTGICSYNVTGISTNNTMTSFLSDGLMEGDFDYTKMSLRVQTGSISLPVGTRIMFYVTT